MPGNKPCQPGCTCRKHALPGGPRPNSGRKQQDFTSISYNGQHRRYRRQFGPASGYLCGGCCGGRADSWARVHGRLGLDLYLDIVPLCWSCHAAYDAPLRSGPPKKDVCDEGHQRTPDNVDRWYRCRTCHREKARDRRQRAEVS